MTVKENSQNLWTLPLTVLKKNTVILVNLQLRLSLNLKMHLIQFLKNGLAQNSQFSEK